MLLNLYSILYLSQQIREEQLPSCGGVRETFMALLYGFGFASSIEKVWDLLAQQREIWPRILEMLV